MYTVNTSPQVVWGTYPGLFYGFFHVYFCFFEIPVKKIYSQL